MDISIVDALLIPPGGGGGGGGRLTTGGGIGGEPGLGRGGRLMRFPEDPGALGGVSLPTYDRRFAGGELGEAGTGGAGTDTGGGGGARVA